jgi:hypothetical protein
MITYLITLEEENGMIAIEASGEEIEPVTEAEVVCANNLLRLVRGDIDHLFGEAIRLAKEEQQLLKTKLN